MSSLNPMTSAERGRAMHALATRLFPVCRSITGPGVRETLRVLGETIPLAIHEVPTGTAVFDWTVPKEWIIREAFVEDRDGRRVIDFRRNNLHVVGYSAPVDRRVSREELQEHLYSLPEQPDAIPYVTSYYQERWGFCMAHRERERLGEGPYRVRIDSELKDGSLTYGECVVPGESAEEVFLSTYVCHPSMANNELSGPVVAAFLGQWIRSAPRRYTYRMVFAPETIGAITYLSRHLDHLQRRVIAGFNLSCVGDERAYSYVGSRYGKTLADKVARHVLGAISPEFRAYSFLERGSDERQYCSPGVDLPLVTLCRSKFAAYPEYHTSLDDLTLVTPAGLEGGYEMARRCVEALEHNRKYRVTCLGEPQLGRRGLYPAVSIRNSSAGARVMMNLIAYADGGNDLIDIANLIGVPVWELPDMAERLEAAGVLERVCG
jgi:aminopeptidase-like protein